MNADTADKTKKKDKETREIQRVALYGFLLNLGLAGMKGILAVWSGSLAVTASAIDSATDSVASLVLLIGLKLSNKKSANFPMGLYKVENLLSVAMAFFIFFAGYEIARHAFSTAFSPPDISFLTILLVLAGTIATFLFGQYAIVAGRRTESPTLVAEGRHRQADVLSSVVVLISIGISYFDLKIDLYGITVDQLAAVLVLLFIAHTGWELLSDGMRVLLDASIDHDTLAEVQQIIESEPMIAEVQSLVGRNAGRFRFLQAVVSVRTDNLQKAHKISERVESNIRQRVPHVERVVIHYEPQTRESLHVAIPLAEPGGKLSRHFGEAPYFAIVRLRVSDNQIDEQEILKNPYVDLEKGKGIRVAEWLVGKNVDLVALREEIMNKGPGYVFSNAGVNVHVLSATDLNGAVMSLVDKDHL